MNITPPTPLPKPQSESLSKSTVRSISALSMTNDLRLTDVTNDDEDGKMMMDDVPVLHSFISPDKTMTAEDISASLLASGVYMVGLMCGMMGGLIIIYKWWMLLMLLIIFMVLTVISPRVTDSLINGLIIVIHGLYIPLRRITSSIGVSLRPSPHTSPTSTTTTTSSSSSSSST